MTSIDQLPRVQEWHDVTPAIFHQEIVPAGRPAVLRGLVSDWPLVSHGRRSAADFSAYLAGFDNGRLAGTMVGPPEAKGRMFYDDDMRGFNFSFSQERLPFVLKGLERQQDAAAPQMIAIQSLAARDFLPGLESENVMPLLQASVVARLWIGNRVTVAPHFDSFDNVACVVAGRRRFVLFPPDQVGNLYVGPIDFTPAGTPISMVPLTDPDFNQYPRYRAALAAASVAELAPGDAIFIPILWWHGVQSLETFNCLVNYWWNDHPPAAPPFSALIHASLLLRDVPDEQKQAWRHLFDHYVFGANGPPLDHLPADRRGVLGPLDAQAEARLRKELARELDR